MDRKFCDSCKTEITDDNPIIAKLFLTPVLTKGTADHGSYSSHMDVGQCCASKLMKMGWRKRKSRKEYQNGRRLRAAERAVGASTSRSKGAAK